MRVSVRYYGCNGLGTALYRDDEFFVVKLDTPYSGMTQLLLNESEFSPIDIESERDAILADMPMTD